MHLKLARPIAAGSRMDLSQVSPVRLAKLSAAEIAALEIPIDATPQRLGDWFEIADGPAADTLVIEGDLSRCDRVGGKLDGGTLRVQGNVGDWLADDMRAGKIIVEGHAGHMAASHLRGGEVTVKGDVGQYAAGAVPGAKHGMRGGTLVVHGKCDCWLAAKLRRGTVIGLGQIDAGCAARMIAGTLFIAPSDDDPLDFYHTLGSGMRRGTILVLGQPPSSRVPGFTDPEACELSYLAILLKALSKYLPKRLDTLASDHQHAVMRSIGDRADHGLGELIWLSPIRPPSQTAPASAFND